ncbi:hypothetical protein [Paractinoplanes rishiriensis]|uniref:Uncharacterized protein n=1 Tax=Paractinoplanes rishiriensis TaxID=1050105 RepID=A0A919K635_9ACTN|nr:hypothetical protein [Actinoplanes rishiriensis]GIE99595.1 hypothetical protein Ari01nite_70600 [Actinoplanes rishiriensis]
MRLADLNGRSVAVWGTGPHARAAVRAVKTYEPTRLIAVDHTAGFLAVPWDDEPAPLAGGDHAHSALVTAEVVIRTPDVPGDHEWLADLRARGVAVTTGSTLWLADNAARTVAVTGGASRALATGLTAYLLKAFDRVVASGEPALALSPADEYVIELPAAECTAETRPPHVTVVTAGEPEPAVLDLLRRGCEMIVVDGTDLALRDAIRGLTDLNGFPPIPAAADDSRFRIEDGQVFCSDEPLFPSDLVRTDGPALCVALAVLDGLGIDVPGARDELAAAVKAFG